MDPFAGAGAGGMADLRRNDEMRRQQDRVTTLESENKALQQQVGTLKAELAEAKNSSESAPAARRGQGSSAASGGAASTAEAEAASLRRTLQLVKQDVDARDEQWREAVGSLTKTYLNRLERVESELAKAGQQRGATPLPAVPSPQPVVAAAATPAPAGLPMATQDQAAELLSCVRGLATGLSTVQRELAELRARPQQVVVAAAPSQVPQQQSTGSVASVVASQQQQPAGSSSASAGLASREQALFDAFSQARTGDANAAVVAPRGRGRGRGSAGLVRTAPASVGVETASAGTGMPPPTTKKRGRPPKSASSQAGTQSMASDTGTGFEERRELIRAQRERLAAAALQRVDGNANLVAEYLHDRAQPSLTQRQVDDLRRKYIARATTLGEPRGLRSAQVLSEQLVELIVQRAGEWHAAGRSDSARNAMMHLIAPLAFQAPFIDAVTQRLASTITAFAGDDDAKRNDVASGPVVAHELAACLAVLFGQTDAAPFSALWFDLAHVTLKTMRRLRDVTDRARCAAVAVSILRGLAQGSEQQAIISARRATLTCIMIRIHVSVILHSALFHDAVESDAGVAFGQQAWSDLCRALQWPLRPSVEDVPLVQERARHHVSRGKTLSDIAFDAVNALRIAAQGESEGVELLYTMARENATNVAPPIVCLIAALCLDFDLTFEPSDAFIAAFLTSCFKGHGFVEVDVPAQLLAASAVLSCSPVPPKASAAFAKDIASSAHHVQHLAKKQQTVAAVRPIMATALSRALVKKVDRFVALPTGGT